MEAQKDHGPESDEAVSLINAEVGAGGSGHDILMRIEIGAGELSEAQKAQAERYVREVREETRGVVVKTLDPGVGGLWDGNNVYIATGILVVHESIERTLAQVEETNEHERYHEEHNHTAPLIVMAETKGDIALVMGNQQFTKIGLIEGLTVLRTGDQFVSAEYITHKNRLIAGMNAAGWDVTYVECALNDEKDVRLIDDRYQSVEEVGVTTPALA